MNCPAVIVILATVSLETVNALFGANSQLFATVTIVGRNSGARVQVPITLTKTGS